MLEHAYQLSFCLVSVVWFGMLGENPYMVTGRKRTLSQAR